MHKVTLITGDGVGPEVAEAARKCVDAVAEIGWDVQEAGAEVYKKEGDPLPERILDSIRENRVALKAPITTPVGKGFRSVNVRLRQTLDLYACVRPCRTIEGIPNSFPGVDIVVVRENTEGMYAGIEYDVGADDTMKLLEFVEETRQKKIASDSAVSLKPISKSASERIVEYAFDYAAMNKRSKVTVVTKSNIMKFSDGLFLHTSEEVAAKHPGTEFDHVLIDALCMHLVQHPRDYDVLVLPNLYGDVVSDLCAGLTGGLGVAPGANVGEEYAVFEAVHGSAPDIAGKGIANPTALVLSAALMLDYLGEHQAADRLRTAVETVIADGAYVTPDLNPKTKAGTAEMTDAIVRALK